MDRMRELEAPPSPLGYSAVQPDDPHRGRIGQGTIASKVRSYRGFQPLLHTLCKFALMLIHFLHICVCVCACVSQHGEPLSPAASTLAMVLTRGLSMEQQKSSRDSLQYSSGYSSQTNTPSCSEDTIPSQGSAAPPPHVHTQRTITAFALNCMGNYYHQYGGNSFPVAA